MKYTIPINNQVTVDINIKGDRYSIDDHGLGIAHYIDLSFEENGFKVCVAGTVVAVVNLKTETVERRESITSTELRMLGEAISLPIEELHKSGLIESLNGIRLVDSQKKEQVETELHTHFIEILTGEEFMDVILSFVLEIPVDKEEHLIGYTLDDAGEKVPFEECISSFVSKENKAKIQSLANELSIPLNGQKDFSHLSLSNVKRSNLVTFVASQIMKNYNGDISLGDVKKIIYYRLLIRSLQKLKESGIRYVELSYSNHSTIKKMLEYAREKGMVEGIKFNFLLSSNRTRLNNPSYARDAKKRLREMMENGMVAGFDLMGEELPISKADMDSNNPNSLINFMRSILSTLNKYPSSVLRLHAGENRLSYANPLVSLLMIDKLVNELGIQIPPPFVRLGHAVFFEEFKGDVYAALLRKYNVVVEINASSNIALGNVINTNELPYRWYKERGIPFVIATDGGGMYLTDPIQEARIAQSAGKDILGYVKETEKKIGR
jgi:hypothetical protein